MATAGWRVAAAVGWASAAGLAAGALAGGRATGGALWAAAAGWAVAGVAAAALLRARRRLDLVADATHELRGPAAALTFAVAALRRAPSAAGWAVRIDGQLDRLVAGLGDLDAARTGGRPAARTRRLLLERVVRAAVDSWRAPLAAGGRELTLCWEAGPELVDADPGRLAQALGNLLANACEHGGGTVTVAVFRPVPETVRIEVRDGGGGPAGGRRRGPAPGRGRGLRIAARAVRCAGGRLAVDHTAEGTVAAIELPRVGGAPLPPGVRR